MYRKIKRTLYWILEKIGAFRKCTIVGCSQGEYEEALKLSKNAICINNGINIEKLNEETKEFTVTFVANGEKSEVKVVEGEKVSKPSDPEKEGYNFLGWYVGDDAYDFEKAVNADLEVTAKFEEKAADELRKALKNFDEAHKAYAKLQLDRLMAT